MAPGLHVSARYVALQGFTFLRPDPGIDTEPFEDAAAERGIPFSFATLVNDDLRELYEADPALVRSDHYFAWRGSAVQRIRARYST
jgi:hypothetical protein